MKILIELPTWLGDAVMATPAIENLINYFKDSEIILVGSTIAIEALKNHPRISKTYILNKKYFYIYKNIKKIGKFDLFISFRGSIRSKFIKLCVSSKIKYQYDKKLYNQGHQVEKYNNFINDCLKINTFASRLILHTEKQNKSSKNKLLGINPGASFGSAKRWYPANFADVAIDLSNQYDVVILGGPGEINIANDIEKYLMKKGLNNFQNLAGKLSIKELISQISGLDLFITGDSGPMHLAAALQIPTVTIFGPTKDVETSQWMNQKSMIVKKNLECQPCMKRTCPLNHHNCMKLVKAKDVLDAVKSFI